jgi:hypothetical protein
MAFKLIASRMALETINSKTLVKFEDMTSNYDFYDIAVAEYLGVIIQIVFPDQEDGFTKFNLITNDITNAEPTSYFNNFKGSIELTIEEVISIINQYTLEQDEVFEKRRSTHRTN